MTKLLMGGNAGTVNQHGKAGSQENSPSAFKIALKRVWILGNKFGERFKRAGNLRVSDRRICRRVGFANTPANTPAANPTLEKGLPALEQSKAK